MPVSTSGRNEDKLAYPPESSTSPNGSPHGRNGPKERRPPSITPRKFTQFFTPRSHGPFNSRKVLGNITRGANNCRESQSSPLQPLESGAAQDDYSHTFTREMKRRKLFHTPSPSPEQSGSSKSTFNSHISSGAGQEDLGEGCTPHTSLCTINVSNVSEGIFQRKISVISGTNRQIKRLDDRGLAGGLLQISFDTNAGSKRRHAAYPVTNWQDQTAQFYSGSDDVHFCTGIESTVRSIPFCTASCNVNSLVAVGDEEGHVRLLESARDSKPKFKDIFLAFRPHSNAILDLCFSSDDSLLVTASGDQTARVVDMTTQTTISVLAKHSASLKQVRFQPGVSSNSVIATSSRDGSVKIWDLRCKGTEPVQSIHIQPNDSEDASTRSSTSEISYCRAIGGIYDAHRPLPHVLNSHTALSNNGQMRAEIPGRNGDVSVTAVTFLPEGQEHLLLTGSEANASVKLWDMRSLYSTRQKTAVPLSCTTLPKSHTQWRHFGINSINLSHDGSRLYTLCKDNTVYTYSVAHLILGQAPELSATVRGRRQNTECQEGLGPLYGFRHPQLHATSFYVKSAIRPAKSGKVEMLAVGSCDGCTILFPTDEKYLQAGHLIEDRPLARKCSESLFNSSRFDDSITLSYNGTSLIRGHDREVGALSWTSDGGLITVGDDFLVRCWREGNEARNLRIGGEQGGRRWNCGWADVPPSYDEEG